MKPFYLGLLLLAGCPDVDVDENETETGPQVEFDPSNSIVPFPNNLVLSADGSKVNLPASACESPTSMAVRTGVLNTLDGFGAYQAVMQVTLTEAVDISTAAANVHVYRRDGATVTEVPGIIAMPSMTLRFDAANCTMPTPVASLVLVSPAPLRQKSLYDVVITEGLKTAAGGDFGPSGTWLIARSAVPPVVIENGVVVTNNTPLDPKDPAQLAQLGSIEFLWKAHQPFLDAVDEMHPRDTILVAWEFRTATVTDPLDTTVTGSLAADLPTTGFLGFALPPGVPVAGQGEAVLISALNASTGGNGVAACAAIGCANVNDVFGGIFSSRQYQVPGPNPIGGIDPPPVPGPWNDPIKPTVPGNELSPNITAFAMIPKGTPPANGWPTVIFGHGLGSSKESLAVFGPQLAGAGFASIAIDFVAHGSRAVRISDQGACAGTPNPSALPQCFGLFLSTDLAGTRDNIRQTVLDLHRLQLALATCSTGTGCAAPISGGAFKVDATKIVYAGISLGGIIGSTFTATNSNVKAAVLNVPGVGLIDVLENTQTVSIRCSLVNSLIDAGILMGEKFAGGATGLCIEQDQGWKTQPGYRQFSTIARWALDPADGANYTPMLAAKRILIQEVIGDLVVPNIATEREAALVGLAPMAADPAASAAPAPSAAITTMPMTNKFVQYTNLPAMAPSFPGNTFQHASLLSPVADGNAGQLGTIRMQTDAITFLVLNR